MAEAPPPIRPEASRPKPKEAPKAEVPKQDNHTKLDVDRLEDTAFKPDDEIGKLRGLLKSMKGEKKPMNIETDHQKSQKLVDKKQKLIKNPMARTNLGLTAVDKDGNVHKLNQDWQPTAESGLAPMADLAPSEKLKQEVRTEEKVQVTNPETGETQELNVIKANWDEFTSGKQERVMVFLPPIDNAIAKGPTNYRLEELARQFDMPTLAIDYPSVGGSDKITRAQKNSIKKGEGFSQIADAELRVMQTLGIKEIDLVGQSMGAFTAVEIARAADKFGIKIKNLGIVEVPGIDDIPIGEFAKRFLSENKYLGLYQSAPYDPRMREASGFDNSVFRQMKDIAKIPFSLMKDSGFTYAKAMSKKVIPEFLKQAMGSNSETKLHIINGTTSGISPAEANNALVEELKSAGYGDRVRHMSLPGMGHTALENARVFAATMKLAFTGASL